jgi:hypothetical protein
MSLSDRERRILAEIEQDLRWQDRAFACRIDALNARPARRRRHPGLVSRREMAFILLLVISMTLLSAIVLIATGRPRTSPAVHPQDVVSTSGAPGITPH